MGPVLNLPLMHNNASQMLTVNRSLLEWFIALFTQCISLRTHL